MLLTLAELKAELGITETDRDGRLTRLVTAAGKAVETYLGWSPEVTDYTVYENPNAGRVLLLRDAPPNCPVTITNVWEDWGNPPTFDSTTLLTDGTDYEQERTGGASLIRLTGNWPVQVRRETDRLGKGLYPTTATVKVVFVLDTAAALSAAQGAALAEALVRWNVLTGGMGLGVVSSDGMDGASISIDTKFAQGAKPIEQGPLMSPIAARYLKDYRKNPIG